MTREEAIKILKARKDCNSDHCPSGEDCYKCDEAFSMAIDALEQLSSYEQTINKLTHAISEQEPNTDAVSRQMIEEIKEIMTDIGGNSVYVARMSDIRALPPVTPTRVKAHWVYVDDCEELYDTYWCSNCHNEITVNAEKICDMVFVIEEMESCPKCGAEMKEGDA